MEQYVHFGVTILKVRQLFMVFHLTIHCIVILGLYTKTCYQDISLTRVTIGKQYGTYPCQKVPHFHLKALKSFFFHMAQFLSKSNLEFLAIHISE